MSYEGNVSPVNTESFDIVGDNSTTEFYIYYDRIHDNSASIEVYNTEDSPIEEPTIQREILSYYSCRITFAVAPTTSETYKVTVQGKAPKFLNVVLSSSLDTKFDIYAHNLGGDTLSQVSTYSNFFTYEATIHPNGQQILFSGDPDTTDLEIYAVDFNLGRTLATPTRLTNSAFDKTRLAISPDGKKLTWMTDEGTGTFSIKIADYDSVTKTISNETFLYNSALEDRIGRQPFSPDSTKVVFTTGGVVRTINVDGTGLSAAHPLSPTDASYPAWSPDNTRFAVSGEGDSGPGDGDIIIINIDGTGSAVDITQNATSSVEYPIWVNSDLLINLADSGAGGTGHISRINSNGSGSQIIVSGTTYPNSTPFYGRTIFEKETLSYTEKVLYHSNQNGDYQLYAMDSDGSNKVRITNNIYSDTNPSLSPDGTRLAWNSDRDGGTQIFVAGISIRPSGEIILGEAVNVSNNANEEHQPRWSPDSRQLSFYRLISGKGHVWIMDSTDTSGTDTNKKDISNGNFGTSLGDRSTSWNPNGEYILFERSDPGNYHIVETKISDLSETIIYQGGTYDIHPYYTPDGADIIFSTFDGVDYNLKRFNIVANSVVDQITNVGTNEFSPVVSPDGQYVVYGGENKIYKVDIFGSNIISTLATDVSDIYGGAFWGKLKKRTIT